MIRLLCAAIMFFLAICGPGVAQQSNRPLRLGPDFSGIKPGPNIAGKLSDEETAVLAQLAKLDANIAGAVKNEIVEAESYLERIRRLGVRFYQFEKTVEQVEKLYSSGDQTAAKLDEVLAVDGALLRLIRIMVQKRNGLGLGFAALKPIQEWDDRVKVARKRRRQALGLSPKFGQTPGPNDRDQMTDVCSYVRNGPAAGWKNIKQACYSHWSIGACSFLLPAMHNVAKCQKALQDAREGRQTRPDDMGFLCSPAGSQTTGLLPAP